MHRKIAAALGAFLVLALTLSSRTGGETFSALADEPLPPVTSVSSVQVGASSSTSSEEPVTGSGSSSSGISSAAASGASSVSSAAIGPCLDNWVIQPAPFTTTNPLLEPVIVVGQMQEGGCFYKDYNRRALRSKDAYTGGIAFDMAFRLMDGEPNGGEDVATIMLRTDGTQLGKRSWEATNGVKVRIGPGGLSVEQSFWDGTKITNISLGTAEVGAAHNTYYLVRVEDDRTQNQIRVFFKEAALLGSGFGDAVISVQPSPLPEPLGNYVMLYNREPVGAVWHSTEYLNPTITALP